jgi:hypothetical protein
MTKSRGEAAMLRAVPKNWLSTKYKVLEDDTTIAMVEPSSFREAARLTIKGSSYRAYREGLMSGAFILEIEGSILARAVKPSVFYRSFQVEHEGTQYILAAESAWTRKFVLSERGVRLGSVYPENAMTRKAVVDFPEEISLPGRIFMFWLVMILWSGDSDSASAS